MKKIFVIAVFVAVIGVLCAVFFTHGSRQEQSDEKPWTVGENAPSETVTEETTRAPYEDAVEAFSDYVNETLRASYAILSTEEDAVYTQDDLRKALLGVYIYDVDTDEEQELAVARAEDDGVFLDMYEFRDGKVQLADSMRLTLDPMESTDLALSLQDFAHLSARLTIFPDGANRYLCLTEEQQFAQEVATTMRAEPETTEPTSEDADETTEPQTEVAERSRAGEYNAYTVVIEYAKGKLTAKKSFRLRQRGFELSLMCTDNVTLLYRYPAAETAKYNDLPMAFQLEFEKLGLKAPQITAQDGALTAYKVTPVDNAQTVFSLDAAPTGAKIGESGFLQSFVLPF